MKNLSNLLAIVLILAFSLIFVGCSEQSASADIKNPVSVWDFPEKEANEVIDKAIRSSLYDHTIGSKQSGIVDYNDDFQDVEVLAEDYAKDLRYNAEGYDKLIKFTCMMRFKDEEDYSPVRVYVHTAVARAVGEGQFKNMLGEAWQSKVQYLGNFQGEESEKEKAAYMKIINKIKADKKKRGES